MCRFFCVLACLNEFVVHVALCRPLFLMYMYLYIRVCVLVLVLCMGFEWNPVCMLVRCEIVVLLRMPFGGGRCRS